MEVDLHDLGDLFAADSAGSGLHARSAEAVAAGRTHAGHRPFAAVLAVDVAAQLSDLRSQRGKSALRGGDFFAEVGGAEAAGGVGVQHFLRFGVGRWLREQVADVAGSGAAAGERLAVRWDMCESAGIPQSTPPRTAPHAVHEHIATRLLLSASFL